MDIPPPLGGNTHALSQHFWCKYVLRVSMGAGSDESPASPDESPAAAPATPAQLPLTPVALATKAQDLAEWRAAAVEAANVSAGLWLSYLFVLFYLLIAVGGVTHRTLFFENPVKLPFLNVDLSL